jgi:hypothetical protein
MRKLLVGRECSSPKFGNHDSRATADVYSRKNPRLIFSAANGSLVGISNRSLWTSGLFQNLHQINDLSYLWSREILWNSRDSIL